MVILAWMMGCGATPAEGSNVCGTIVREDGAPAADTISIMTIAEGHAGCEPPDTGADTDGPWWDEVIDEPEDLGDRFEAAVPAGGYAVEVVAGGGGYGGCQAFTVADDSTCAAEPIVTVREIVMADKPNLYLYPTRPQRVDVRIPAWQRITAAAPAYPADGWRVVARPTGRLDTAAGPRTYLFYELAWEAERFQTDAGWCVGGDVAQATIEDAMADLGFRPNEIADFAEAWDADFPDAAEVTVFPQVDDLSAIRIDPQPDSFLRVWFYVAPGCGATEAPVLQAPVRAGFHAAEWGVAFAPGMGAGDLMIE